MKMFAGIDFGKVTSCGIISADKGTLRLVDTVQVDLSDLEPKPRKSKKGEKRAKRKGVTPDQLATRLVRLDDFLDLVLTSWTFDCIGIEIPPGVRDQKVFQQLSMYYGLALARCAKVGAPCKPMTVSEWRRLAGIRGKPPSELKQTARTNWVKGTVIKTVNRNLGSNFEIKEHDRADSAGIAFAVAVAKGECNEPDEIWHP